MQIFIYDNFLELVRMSHFSASKSSLQTLPHWSVVEVLGEV